MSDEPFVDPSAAPAEEAAPEAAAEQPEAPQEQGFNPEAAYGHLAGQVDEIRGYLANLSQPQEYGYDEQQQQPAGQEEFDPFDPNSFQTAVGRAVQEQIAPLHQALAPLVERQRDEASEQFVTGAFERIGVPDDLRDQVLVMSGGYRLAGQSPEQAISSAWQAIQGLRGSGVQAGREEQRQELEQIVSAPGVPQGTQPGAVQSQRRPQSMEEAAKRIAAGMGIRD